VVNLNIDNSVLAALSGFGGIVLTQAVNVIVTKVNSKKDITMLDRQQLSNDQQAFFDMVMNQVKALQERADHLESEMTTWKEEALSLRAENTQLKNKLDNLEGRLGGGEGE
jgi:chromosome segregation ATPase